MSDAGRPHAPHLTYLCDDPDCCYNGCPDVYCLACEESWPCSDWSARHTRARVLAQHRYVLRKHYPGDADMVQWELRRIESEMDRGIGGHTWREPVAP